MARVFASEEASYYEQFWLAILLITSLHGDIGAVELSRQRNFHVFLIGPSILEWEINVECGGRGTVRLFSLLPKCMNARASTSSNNQELFQFGGKHHRLMWQPQYDCGLDDVISPLLDSTAFQY